MEADHRHLPTHLYKYRTLDGPDYRFTKDLLLNAVLWWASPLDFNDPFDCVPRLDTSASRADKVRYGVKYARTKQIGSNRQERRAFASDIYRSRLRRPPGADGEAGGNDAWRAGLRTLGALCLTEHFDSMLMWGHYANSHKGICLEFETSKLPFSNAHPVKYGLDRPTYRPFQEDRGSAFDICQHKADFWAYEGEWRIFQPGKVGLSPYPSESLTAVILGASISDEDERAVRNLLRQRSRAVQIRRARLDPTVYRLNVVDA